jgi:hypothetical protein
MGTAGVRDSRNQLGLSNLDDPDTGVRTEKENRGEKGPVEDERNHQCAKRVIRTFVWQFHRDLVVDSDDRIGSDCRTDRTRQAEEGDGWGRSRDCGTKGMSTSVRDADRPSREM